MHEIAKSHYNTELPRPTFFKRLNIPKGVMSGTVPDVDFSMYEIVELCKQKSKKRSSSKDGESVLSAVPLCDAEEHRVLPGNLFCKSNENTVVKKSSANVSDLYAMVDLSKK